MTRFVSAVSADEMAAMPDATTQATSSAQRRSFQASNQILADANPAMMTPVRRIAPSSMPHALQHALMEKQN
ncbi:MAG: hypothetical protein J0I13_03465 [Rhizobiales bacterium]|nr:hypothetical protein [Hyphomicrobiales bacterium]